MKTHKIFGIIFSVLALIFCAYFMLQPEFDYHLEAYFDLDYLMRLLPLVIGFMLLYGGILLFVSPVRANFSLGLFGHTAVEEIIFDWLGFSKTYLSNGGMVLFLICGLIALWIAYTDTFSSKKLSVVEAIIGLVFGTFLALY